MTSCLKRVLHSFSPRKRGLAAVLALGMLSQFSSPLGFLNPGPRALYAAEQQWNSEDFISEGHTLYGLSKSGLEKLSNTDGRLELPRVGTDGTALTQIAAFAFRPNKSQEIKEYTGREGIGGEINDLDVDGNVIVDKGANFSTGRLRQVHIPEGYTHIGQDAFAFNKVLSELHLPQGLVSISDYAFGHCALSRVELPDSLHTIKDQAFFDNNIQETLKLPRSLQLLGERVFKSNRISDVDFNQAPLTELDEGVFEDNQISTLTLGAEIQKIAADAFNGNPGDLAYGGAVVLKTADGKNSHQLPSLGNYLIDPDEEKKTSELDIDDREWTEADFLYDPEDASCILGFSPIGSIKIRSNKDLVLPPSHNGVPLQKIAANAFRNVDFDASSLRKYDIASLSLPSTVTEIGAFAFQSNKLTELMLDPDDPLRVIAEGAFMNNQIDLLVLPSGLEKIGDAAFHINNISMVLIPREVQHIGRSAFRQNNIIYGLGFEDGSKVQKIDEMAFAESNLSAVDFSNAQGIRDIAVQAFAANDLSVLELPKSLLTVGPEAFRSNQLTEVQAPAELQSISFNAFDDNPGLPNYGDKVLVQLPSGTQEHKLADGDNFVVAPELKAADKSPVRLLLDKVKAALNAAQELPEGPDLRPEMLGALNEIRTAGEGLLAKEQLSLGELAQFTFRATFFLDRLDLDRAIKRADSALQKPVNKEAIPLLRDKLDYVKLHANNAAWTAEKIARAEHELRLLTELCLNEGAISRAKMVQGVHELQTSLPIPPYFIGLNVYFDPDTDKILYVLDRSYSIGEGTLDEYGNQVLNVDEDNEGYHELALVTLADYEGLPAAELEKNTVDSIGSIREVPRASEHRAGLYAAVLDAARDYLRFKAPSTEPSPTAVPSTAPSTGPSPTAAPSTAPSTGPSPTAAPSTAPSTGPSPTAAPGTAATPARALPRTGEAAPRTLPLLLILGLGCSLYVCAKARKER